jgi:hypothetical protein
VALQRRPDGQSGDQDENEKKDYEGRIFVRPFLPFGEAVPGSASGSPAPWARKKALATYKTPGVRRSSRPPASQADGMRYVSPQAATTSARRQFFEYVRSSSA